MSTKGLEGTKKDEVKSYNDIIKEERKTALTPVYEPLVLNLEMLRNLVDALDKPASEKSTLGKMYHDNPIFLNAQLDEMFRFLVTLASIDASELVSIEGKGKEISVNASILSTNSKVSLKVKSGSSTSVIDDWTVDEVNRKKNSIDVAEYTAVLKSETAKKYDYNEGEIPTVVIATGESDSHPTTEASYKLVKKSLTGWKFEMVK